MKIPEQIIGYLVFNEVEYPFLYDDAALKLFPPDKKTWENNRWESIRKLANFKKQNKWI
jgi:hypothetical protein